MYCWAESLEFFDVFFASELEHRAHDRHARVTACESDLIFQFRTQ